MRSKEGADLVVLLSHNGFDVDRKLAGRINGIDVILTAHTHDALPEPVMVGNTMLIASGSNGKFITRLDLDVRDGEVKGFAHKLIPIFSDVITPDPVMTQLINDQRAPFINELTEVLGTTDTELYRRGNFNGTWDDLLCNALIDVREADIALSPGFRWGPSLIAGQDITREDLFNATAMSYPNAYRSEMTGELIHTILEDVADNLFNPDPYYQQGGDMVRVGGMGYTIDINKPQGSRLTNMTLLKTGEKIEPSKTYVVAGWASVNEGTEGPPIWDVAEEWIKRQGNVSYRPQQVGKCNRHVTLKASVIPGPFFRWQCQSRGSQRFNFLRKCFFHDLYQFAKGPAYVLRWPIQLLGDSMGQSTSRRNFIKAGIAAGTGLSAGAARAQGDPQNYRCAEMGTGNWATG